MATHSRRSRVPWLAVLIVTVAARARAPQLRVEPAPDPPRRVQMGFGIGVFSYRPPHLERRSVWGGALSLTANVTERQGITLEYSGYELGPGRNVSFLLIGPRIARFWPVTNTH